MTKISVVFNTLNEENNLEKSLISVKHFADEVVVVDMESEDATKIIAAKHGAKVFNHKKTGYVEPARNYAINKASGKWILLLDADEFISKSLAGKLKLITKSKNTADYYRIPRKNVIFKKWIKHTNWWPDYQLRFFKKGFVKWDSEIHSIPLTKGKGADLDADEKTAIIHNNYQSLEQFVSRLNRYTSIQAKQKLQNKYVFSWKDLIDKPTSEFVNRFVKGHGYKDGVHGLALSLLQSFSEFLVYAKIWQLDNFKENKLTIGDVAHQLYLSDNEIFWWLYNARAENEKNIIKKIWLKTLKNLKYQ